MGGASLPRRAVKAFRSAGATEEMIASARLIYGSLPNEPPGRPRKYKNGKEADHAFYMRHRDRFREKRMISTKNSHPISRKYAEEIGRVLIGTEMLPTKPASPEADPLGGSRAWLETAWPDAVLAAPRVLSLKEVLVSAAGGNVDREADVLTISALLDKGCDLEADILPVVAGTVPELPRPLDIGLQIAAPIEEGADRLDIQLGLDMPLSRPVEAAPNFLAFPRPR
jgi:hypothetical protein